jgi:5-methylcytosine-specific restriction endonuclease McrA
MGKAYTSLRAGGWVGFWLDNNLHNDAMHDLPREQCEECQRTIADHGSMPQRMALIRAYENLKRPEKKGTVPIALRRAVFERDNNTCQHCGTHENLSIDHIYPEVWGGPTTLDNLQVLCRPCNNRKADRKP